MEGHPRGRSFSFETPTRLRINAACQQQTWHVSGGGSIDFPSSRLKNHTHQHTRITHINDKRDEDQRVSLSMLAPV